MDKGASKETWVYVVDGYRPEALLGDRDAEDLGIFTFHKEGREEAQGKLLVSDLRARGIKAVTGREEGVQVTMEERGPTMALIDRFKGTAISDKIGKLDVESVEDDHNETIEEESFIQNALNRLDQRHAAEMGDKIDKLDGESVEDDHDETIEERVILSECSQ